MPIDPGTATLIASAIAAAAKAGGDFLSNKKTDKAARLRSKELKRETQANLFDDALNRSTALEAHRLGASGKMAKRKTKSMQDTADLLRGAFNI